MSAAQARELRVVVMLKIFDLIVARYFERMPAWLKPHVCNHAWERTGEHHSKARYFCRKCKRRKQENFHVVMK
jgi:hypothetical protein